MIPELFGSLADLLRRLATIHNPEYWSDGLEASPVWLDAWEGLRDAFGLAQSQYNPLSGELDLLLSSQGAEWGFWQLPCWCRMVLMLADVTSTDLSSAMVLTGPRQGADGWVSCPTRWSRCRHALREDFSSYEPTGWEKVLNGLHAEMIAALERREDSAALLKPNLNEAREAVKNITEWYEQNTAKQVSTKKKVTRGNAADGTRKIDMACDYILANPGHADLLPAELAKIIGCSKTLFSTDENKRRIEVAKATARRNLGRIQRGFGSSHTPDAAVHTDWDEIDQRLENE